MVKSGATGRRPCTTPAEVIFSSRDLTARMYAEEIPGIRRKKGIIELLGKTAGCIRGAAGSLFGMFKWSFTLLSSILAALGVFGAIGAIYLSYRDGEMSGWSVVRIFFFIAVLLWILMKIGSGNKKT